ncbi:hypothetical protein X741_01030 [Mesorhizobium sp. LNHC229A00]|nr:hypothetical protein X741_01030 [Mesorhizobium sp. LNHC229A00]
MESFFFEFYLCPKNRFPLFADAVLRFGIKL